jgi:hypothetical protein
MGNGRVTMSSDSTPSRVRARACRDSASPSAYLLGLDTAWLPVLRVQSAAEDGAGSGGVGLQRRRELAVANAAESDCRSCARRCAVQ